jgi:nicotinate-nucleotide adenylyltransferase
MSQEPIGIVGGTFDPIHKGHIHIALTTLEKTPITTIHFLPCYQPVHRRPPQTLLQDRLEMIRLAIKPYPAFVLDKREIIRSGPSYMIDTLISLREAYPERSLGLILGADAYLHLPEWKSWQLLLEYAHLIVISRISVEIINPIHWLQKRETRDSKRITQTLAGSILLLETSVYLVSATLVRQRIKHHQPIVDLVPGEVVNYIKKHHLYGAA